MNKKALIYDFDGVICDSVNIKTEAFCEIYSPYGNEIVKKVESYHLLHGGISRFEKFKYFHQNFLNKKLNKNDINDLALKFSRIVLKKVIDSNYILGALNFIKDKSLKYKQYICTGTPQNEIEIILKEKKIQSYFKGVYGSPDSKVSIIKKIQEDKKFLDSEILFFGDASTDYNAAKISNIDFIAINADNYYQDAIHNFNNFKELDKCQLF